MSTPDALLAKIGSLFPSARIVEIRAAAPIVEVEPVVRHDRYREPHFKRAALKVFDNGWAPIAQTGWSGGDRKPAQDFSRAGGVVRPSEVAKKRPDRGYVADWAQVFADENLALVFGPASGGAFCLDMDVIDPDLAAKIRAIADRVLGHTPLIRIGRAPRCAMIYRHDGDVLNKAFKFASAEDECVADAEKQAIEVLADGKMLTAFGTHHATGKLFHWLERSPLDATPADAPLVTWDQVCKFLDEVAGIRGFISAGGGSRGGIDPALITDFRAEKSGIFEPRMRVDGAPWRYESGEVVEEREAWLLAYTGMLCRANSEMCLSEEGVAKLTRHAMATAALVLRRSGRWGQNGSVSGAVVDKMRRTSAKVASGVRKLQSGEELTDEDLRPFRLTHVGGDAYSRPAATKIPRVRPSDGALDWIGPGERIAGLTAWERNKGAVRPLGKPTLVEGAREARKLITDRKAIGAEISQKIDAALNVAFANVGELGGRPTVHIIPPPTGSAKTVRSLMASLRYCKEHPRQKGEGPVIFTMPSHANIDEAVKVANSVEGVDVDWPDPVDFCAFARSLGVKAMVYKGMIPAGCKRVQERKLLNKAGIGASGLCESIKSELIFGTDGDREEVEERCPHWGDCPARQMQIDAEIADLILCPHWYVTAPTLPAALKNARCVFGDESLVFRLIHTAFLPLTSLEIGRKPPRLTKKERMSGLTPEHLLMDRIEAVKIVLKAWDEKADPAQRLFEANGGKRMAETAKAICGRAQDVIMDVHADMTLADVERMSASPKGTDLLLEWRFWDLILDRIRLLEADQVSPGHAKGARDYRIQRLLLGGATVTPGWRLSWRLNPNWGASPWVLLDASANLQITEKLFKGSNVQLHAIDAPLNLRTVLIADRTYSTASLVAGENATAEKKEASAKLLGRIGQAISLVAAFHGNRKTLVGATKAVRAALFGAYDKPANVEHGHFGAFRGLDFAKNYAVVIGVGRTEMPIWAVDGYAAALTYDDDQPEEPYDVNGDGFVTGDDGVERPLFRKPEAQTVPLRSGHDVILSVPKVKGMWGRLVDEQWRDEESRQLIGRVRPIFRDDTPTAIIISSCVPKGVIIDEMLALDDLLAGKRGQVWDAVRRAGGVVDEVVTTALAAPDDQAEVKEAMTALLDRPGSKMGGFTPLKWIDSQGVAHRSLVASWTTDIEGAFRRAYAAAGLHPDDLASVEVGEPNAPISDAPARAPDALQISLGSRDEIVWREEQRRLTACSFKVSCGST